jgi:hypothetical protein
MKLKIKAYVTGNRHIVYGEKDRKGIGEKGI